MVINLTILTIDYPTIQLVIIDAGDKSTFFFNCLFLPQLAKVEMEIGGKT